MSRVRIAAAIAGSFLVYLAPVISSPAAEMTAWIDAIWRELTAWYSPREDLVAYDLALIAAVQLAALAVCLRTARRPSLLSIGVALGAAVLIHLSVIAPLYETVIPAWVMVEAPARPETAEWQDERTIPDRVLFLHGGSVDEHQWRADPRLQSAPGPQHLVLEEQKPRRRVRVVRIPDSAR